jgi:hypothetical protein
VNSSCIRTSPVSSPPSTIAVSVADSNNISVLGLETTPSQQSRGHSIRSFGVTAGSTFIVSERRPRNITSTSTDLWVMQSMAPMSRIDFWLTGTSHRRELIDAFETSHIVGMTHDGAYVVRSRDLTSETSFQ